AASVERLDDQLDVASAEEPEVAGLGGQGSRMGGSGLTGGRLPRGLDLKASVQAEDGVRAETPERGILPCDGGQRGGEALRRLLGVAQRCASGRTAGEDRSIGDGLEGLTLGIGVSPGLIRSGVGDVDVDLEVGQACGEKPETFVDGAAVEDLDSELDVPLI